MNKAIFILFIATGAMLTGCETESVEVTDSGYEYVTCVDLEGNPGESGDYVFIHALGMVNDSVLFDTRNEGEPTPVQLPEEGAARGQLAPLQDVLALMSEGDSIRFEYPLDSFKVPLPELPNDATSLTYHVKVFDIMSPQEFEQWRSNEMKKNEARLDDVVEFVNTVYADYKAGNLDIQRTESGLGYVIHEQGSGATPEQGQVVNAQYYGILAEDGEEFDNSFQRGRPFAFQLGMGMVIPGWDEGFGLLNPGTRATLFIPSELGYGEMGSPPVIPADADLIFYVELEDIR